MSVYDGQSNFSGGEVTRRKTLDMENTQCAFLMNWQLGAGGQLVKRRGYTQLTDSLKNSNGSPATLDGIHYYTDGTTRYLLLAYAGKIRRYNLTLGELESSAISTGVFTRLSTGFYGAVHFLDFYNKVIIGNENNSDAPLQYDGTTVSALSSPVANYSFFASRQGFLHGVANLNTSNNYRVDVANSLGAGYVTTPWDDYFGVTQSTAEPIKAIIPYGEELTVYSRDNIYRLTGSSVGQFETTDVWKGTGAHSFESVQNFKELGTLFFSNDGFHVYRGYPQLASKNIQGIISQIPAGRYGSTWARVASIGDQKIPHYLCGATTLTRNATGDHAKNDTLLLMNRDGGWMHWEDVPCDVFCTGYDNAGNVVIFAGDREGNLWQIDNAVTDNGKAIVSKYLSRPFFFQTLDVEKVLDSLLIFGRSSGDTKVSIDIIDNEETVTALGDFEFSKDTAVPSYFQDIILDEPEHYLGKEREQKILADGLGYIGNRLWCQVMVTHSDPIDFELTQLLLRAELAGETE